MDVARFYVDTVNANIREFGGHRDSCSVHLETVVEDFRGFCDWLGVEHDIDRATAE